MNDDLEFIYENMTLRNNINTLISEINVQQLEFGFNDPRKPVETKPTDTGDVDEKTLLNNVKEMLKTYKAEHDKEKRKLLLTNIINEMAKLYKEEAKEIVDKFEKDPIKTTRGNYGKYMSLLSSLDGIHRSAMITALKNAGAGRGLYDAVKIIQGNY